MLTGFAFTLSVMTRSLTGLYHRTVLDVSLLTINATPALLLPVYFPEYIIVLPSAVLNLPWPSHQCSAIPITAKPHLYISLSTTVIFPWVIPWTFHVPVVIGLRNEMPLLSCLIPSSFRLPGAEFGPPPSS